MDLATLEWQRSGTDDGALEVAFVPASGFSRDPAAPAAAGLPARGAREDAIQWVLLRVAGDPADRVLVYDRTEWLSFVDGAASGEFDAAAELRPRPPRYSRGHRDAAAYAS